MRIICGLLNFLLVLNVYSQNQTDIIIKHNGEHLNVKVIAVDEEITFFYPNESVINGLGKSCVKEIIFTSGRIQQITEKVILNSIDDWEKVQITANPEDIKCLVRKGDITASASNSWNFKSKTGVDKKAIEKIKKEAVALKAHIILIQSENKSNANFWSGASSSKNGVAYGYE